MQASVAEFTLRLNKCGVFVSAFGTTTIVDRPPACFILAVKCQVGRQPLTRVTEVLWRKMADECIQTGSCFASGFICDHELGIVTETLQLQIQVDTLGLDSISEVRLWFGGLKYAAE